VFQGISSENDILIHAIDMRFSSSSLAKKFYSPVSLEEPLPEESRYNQSEMYIRYGSLERIYLLIF
jgi:hypothetical protein